MKKKTVGYLAIAGALSFGIIGGVGVPAFAATNTPTAEQATKTVKKDLDAATKQKVKTIMDDTKKQLQELGVKLPEKEKRKEMFAGLDEQAKEIDFRARKVWKINTRTSKRGINKVRRKNAGER